MGFECTDWYYAHMYQVHGVEADYEFDTLQTEPPVQPQYVQRKDSIFPAFINAIKRRLGFW
ncbi:hypothetical protein LPJ63_005009 [Coemansia sp. RSA 2711]|nr:hypothetical protein LPJ63_005025 [Coemansia sp. RSA 2711]KAJ2315265.1 hypothetical protein IWW54_000406 [Coemansia sp. RSA 2705]KAJ2322087.1 hypothetical protein IWW52_000325 [Coemansia sp. RSA 2704]KAJ2329996.1 hypothetical protein IWW51_000244 [Coemansia sp. RSA 2702]KAJ2366941.1 hypothetical protein H4S01_002435 [Coemansia sp. RSA 2610]KAJ2389872.1 hypothetical protein H4S02_002152 [Coemansia sp. RSA 2611]KAJ2739735.1 hypothetical protein H4R23_000255 [Coemansia sp. Cherry 401B]